MIRTAGVSAGFVLVFAAAGCCLASPRVEQTLPEKDSVKGFSILANSLQYGKGSDLTRIYNGGYELYTKNGVVDAARQIYQRRNDYVEVTVHSLRSRQAALDFLKYWQKENKVKSLTKTGTSVYFAATKPSVTIYAATGRFLVTVSAFYSTGKERKDAEAFLAAVEKRIGKLRDAS